MNYLKTIPRPADSETARYMSQAAQGVFSFATFRPSQEEVSMLEQAEHSERLSQSGYSLCRQSNHPVRKPRFSLKRLVARMSHDLRIPLASILANAEFLTQSNLSKKERDEFYEEIRSSIDRMNELVSDLLECSKGERASSARDWKYRRDNRAGDKDDQRKTGVPTYYHHASSRGIGRRLVQRQPYGTSGG